MVQALPASLGPLVNFFLILLAEGNMRNGSSSSLIDVVETKQVGPCTFVRITRTDTVCPANQPHR
jgi:hypothetical protein